MIVALLGLTSNENKPNKNNLSKKKKNLNTMSLVNKITKSFRWLRWSTVCAIIFYAFFIGLILHSTSYKLQHSMKSRRNTQKQPQQHHELEQEKKQMQKQLRNSVKQQLLNSFIGNNLLQEPQKQQKLIPSKGTDQQQQAGGSKDIVFPQKQTKYSEPETVILVGSSVNEKKILEKAFKGADKNKDNRLTIQELGVYINDRIVKHIEQAIVMNPVEFQQVDRAPPDGLITWEEYHRFFLKEHNMTDASLDDHKEIKNIALNRKAREDMMRDKARWSEAAKTDLFSLSIDEYLSFRHPESSVSNLLDLVDDLLRQFDDDGDDQLTIEEFSELNIDDSDDLMRKSLISKTKAERQEEFKQIIDRNHDGKADRAELLDYVNPKNPRYALQEAATLFSLCDEDKDGYLTFNELIANTEITLSSKMIDTANIFHTEF